MWENDPQHMEPNNSEALTPMTTTPDKVFADLSRLSIVTHVSRFPLKSHITVLSTKILLSSLPLPNYAIAQENKVEQSVLSNQDPTRDTHALRTSTKNTHSRLSTIAVPDTENASEVSTSSKVKIVGERPNNRIDRQVYDINSDISTSNDSVADALNKVPSASVLQDGTVTLRGSSNVQVLIDGKPSAMLQGSNRGATLQSMPSDYFQSIEVLNNPGAEFGNESGSGPIINLVTRRNRKPGGFSLFNANQGTSGRKNVALSGNYNSGRWGFQASTNFRHDERDVIGLSSREYISAVDARTTRSMLASTSIGLTDSFGMNAGLNYNLGERDILSAVFSVLSQSGEQHGTDHYAVFGPLGSATNEFLSINSRPSDGRNYNAALTWEHNGYERGDALKFDLRISSSQNKNSNKYEKFYSTRQVTNDENDNSGTLQENKSSSRIADLTMDYQRPHANGLIKLGFKISHNTDGSELDYLNVDELHNIVIPDPRYTNTFDVNTTSAALYGSWQWRPKEKWAALLGIRAEYGRIDTHQRTTLVDLTNYYFNALPSGFATYKLTEDTNLRFSYSRRVRRPMSFQLNPFVVHINDLTESAGNAQLRPVITDSVEVGVETHMGGLDASMRSYCTNERGAIQLKNSLINNTILLLRPENVGKGRASGIEFSLNGKLTKKVSINSNANISYTQQRQFDLAGSSFVRNNSSLTVQSKISYEFTSADQLQLSVNAQGRTLSGRGYREPTFSTELSVRHTLTPTASVLLKIRNLFDKQNIETITNLPTLKEQSSRKYDGRTVYLGVSWRFGGVSRGSHALPN